MLNTPFVDQSPALEDENPTTNSNTPISTAHTPALLGIDLTTFVLCLIPSAALLALLCNMVPRYKKFLIAGMNCKTFLSL